MAGRFVDSMGHYGTPDILKKWTNIFNGGASISNVAPAGRTDTNAIFFTTSLGSSGACTKTLDYQSGWTCGWAINCVASPNGIAGGIYQLINNGASLATLAIQPDSTLAVTIGASTTGYPGFAMNPSQWYYIEIGTVIGTTGLNISVNATVHVNGVNLFNTGTIDTGIAILGTIHGTASANRHLFSGELGNNGTYIKDLYIVDNNNADGLNVNTFLGDVTVGFLFPNTDNGVAFSLFPNTGTHFSKVNDNPPDGDTTYIFGNTLVADDFLWQHISAFTGTVPFVHFGIYARKDDQGTRLVKHTVGGTAPTPAFSPGDTYLYYFVALDGPPGGGNWTVTNFNAEDFGVEITA